MATRSTEAMVDAPILKWARDTAGLSREEAWPALQTDEAKVLASENATSARVCRSFEGWRPSIRDN